MNLNTSAFSTEHPSAPNALLIRRAIAAAQSICDVQGQNSPACESTWDHALALQVQPYDPAAVSPEKHELCGTMN